MRRRPPVSAQHAALLARPVASARGEAVRLLIGESGIVRGQMTLYQDTIEALRALSARAQTTENVLFCERRPLTSLEAGYARADALAASLRKIEDEALAALRRLADAEQGYETALRSIDEAGPQTSTWLRAVLLARALETLPAGTREASGS